MASRSLGRRIGRGIGWLAAAVFVLLLVLVAVLLLIANSERGSRWALAQVADVLPESIDLGTVTGTLASPLTLKGFRYDDGQTQVALDQATLSWELLALLDFEVKITGLDASGLAVTLGPAAPADPEPAPSTGPPALPELPVAVSLEAVSLKDFSLRNGASAVEPAEETLRIDELKLAGVWQDALLALSKLSVRAPLFDVDGAASLKAPTGLARLDSPSARLAASALDVQLGGELRLEGFTPMALAVTAEGTLEALELGSRVAPPYALTLEGTLRNALNRPVFDFALTADQAAVGRMSTASDSPPLDARADLALRVDGDLEALSIAGTATLEGAFSTPESGQGSEGRSRLAADLSLIYSPSRLRIETLRIDEMTEGAPTTGRLELGGLVALSEDAPQLDLALAWEQLRWPLQSGSLLRSEGGRGTLLGTLDDYRLVLDGSLASGSERAVDDADADGPQATPVGGQLRLRGDGGTTRFRAEELVLEVFDGRLEGAAELSWADGLNGELRLDLKGLDLEPLAPEFKSNVSGQARLALEQLNAQAPLHFSLAPVALTGDLGKLPLEVDLAGAGHLAPDATPLSGAAPLVLRLDRGLLRLGDNQLTFDGKLDDPALNLSFALEGEQLDQLESFGVPLAGQLTLDGALTGSWSQPQLGLKAQSSRMVAAAQQLEALTLSAELAIDPEAPQKLSLRVDRLSGGGIELKALAVELAGPLIDHQLSVAARLETAAAPLSFSLRERGQAEGLPTSLDGYRSANPLGGLGYQFALSELAIDVTGGPTIALLAGGSGAYGYREPSFSLTPTCLGEGASQLCLAAEGNALDGSPLTLELTQLPFSWLGPWMPPEIALGGALSGSGDFRMTSQDGADNVLPDANLTLTADAVTLSREDDELLGLEPISLVLNSAATGVTMIGRVPLSDGTPASRSSAAPSATPSTVPGVDLRVELAGGNRPFGERGLSGQLEVLLPALDWVAELVPELGRFDGSLKGSVSVGGTVAAPRLLGTGALDAQELFLVSPNLLLKELRVDARSNEMAMDGPIQLKLEGGFTSGQGRAEIAGDLRYDAEDLTAALTLKGERVQLSNTDQALVYASPDLSLGYGAEGLKVRGALAIPQADIVLNTLPETAVTVSGDQVFVDAEAEAEAALEYDADLRVRLGDAVRFEGFGLDARFAGDLRVRQRSGEPALGSGEIRIEDGRYQAYGQDLAIETGRALWSDSPIDQPGIDLRAIRKPRPDIVVGVRARGQLDAPEFSLFSEPSLGESDQLSYLVLGRPIEDNSSAESSLLTQAALALSIRGGNFLSDQFGDQLGVDQIGIETEAGAGNSGAAFVLGKYLTPKLYVSYGLGLLDSVSTLRLEYLLSQRWRLATESSTIESGGDVIYSIERD